MILAKYFKRRCDEIDRLKIKLDKLKSQCTEEQKLLWIKDCTINKYFFSSQEQAMQNDIRILKEILK